MRFPKCASVLLAASMVCTAWVARADADTPSAETENHAAVTQGEAGHAVEHGEGHEKPELLEWDFGSALWTVVVFVILLIILRFSAWNPILNGLRQREKFITDSIESARRDRGEADKLIKQHTERMNKAREEATAIVEEGRRDAEEVRKRIKVEAEAEAEAIVARARHDIELARDQAVKEVYDRTVNLATTVAGKIVRKELSTGDHRGLIDESLAELSRVNN